MSKENEDLSKWWEKVEIPLTLTENDNEFLDFYFPEIKGEEREKQILQFQSKALECYNYPCLKRFGFVKPAIQKHYLYPTLIANSLDNVTVLDIGCCMGTDLRYLISKGINKKNIHGFELLQSFIDLGFEFFNDKNEETSSLFSIADILTQIELDQNLAQFLGKFDIVYTGSVLHLFSLQEQKILLENVKKLLKNGGHFIGRTTGLQEASNSNTHVRGREIYLHNEETLQEFLNESFENEKSIVKLIPRDLSQDFPQSILGSPSMAHARIVLTFSAVKN